MSILKIHTTLAGVLLALALAPNLSGANDTTLPICKDGSTSAHAGRGACSGHGGIDKAATQAATGANASPAPSSTAGESTPSATQKEPAQPNSSPPTTSNSGSMVMCKDGSMAAHGGQGACSGHGGVDHSATMQHSDTGSQSTAQTGATGAGAGNPGATGGDNTNRQGATAPPTHSTTHLAAAPRTEAAPGGGPGKVWVNTDSKVYHCQGDHWYGKTMQGEYLTEADAKAQGFRPDHNRPCE